MTVLWIVDKYLDVSVDHATWTETAKCLIRSGHEVFLLAGRRTEAKPQYGLGGRIQYLSPWKIKKAAFILFHLQLCFRLARGMIRMKPDVLLYHPFACVTVLPYLLLAKMKCIRTRCVLDVRTLPVEFSGWTATLMERLFDFSLALSKNLGGGLTVITPFMREVLCARHRLDPGKIGVWTSGASPELFSPEKVDAAEKRRMKRHLGIDRQFVLIYHGVMSHNRGLQNALKAVALLKQGGFNVLMLLVGEGFAKKMLQELAVQHRIEDRVRFEGPVPIERVPVYISLADAGLLPFPNLLWWRVSSPIKLMEYLAMGKPVIATDIEAHRNVLKDCKAGFLAASDQPETLAEAVRKAFFERANLRDRGRGGRTLVLGRYTWEAQTAELERYLRSIGTHVRPN